MILDYIPTYEINCFNVIKDRIILSNTLDDKTCEWYVYIFRETVMVSRVFYSYLHSSHIMFVRRRSSTNQLYMRKVCISRKFLEFCMARLSGWRALLEIQPSYSESDRLRQHLPKRTLILVAVSFCINFQ